MLKIILVVLLIVIFYVGFILYSDFDDFIESISKFRLEFLLPVFGLLLLATLVKGIRQQIFFKTIGISIPFKKNVLLYYAGFSMTLTPGGSGELIKSIYLKERYKYSLSKSLPIFFIERFYDLLGFITIVTFTLFFIQMIEVTILIIFVIMMTIMIYITINSKFVFRIISKILNKIPIFKKYVNTLDESLDSFQLLTSTKNIAKNWSLTTLSFVIYAIGFYLIFLGFDVHLEILFTTFVTFSSILFGYLSFLPGGVGVTEISVVGFLTNEGISLSLATSIMVMFRLSGWLFLTVVGLITTKLFLK
jgi:uncharacterized protein (TIRG00374 family)